VMLLSRPLSSALKSSANRAISPSLTQSITRPDLVLRVAQIAAGSGAIKSAFWKSVGRLWAVPNACPRIFSLHVAYGYHIATGGWRAFGVDPTANGRVQR